MIFPPDMRCPNPARPSRSRGSRAGSAATRSVPDSPELAESEQAAGKTLSLSHCVGLDLDDLDGGVPVSG